MCVRVPLNYSLSRVRTPERNRFVDSLRLSCVAVCLCVSISVVTQQENHRSLGPTDDRRLWCYANRQKFFGFHWTIWLTDRFRSWIKDKDDLILHQLRGTSSSECVFDHDDGSMMMTNDRWLVVCARVTTLIWFVFWFIHLRQQFLHPRIVRSSLRWLVTDEM